MGDIKDKVEECVPQKDPTARPHYTNFEVMALRACMDGKAGERQQRAAIEYIIRAAGTHDMSYRPEDPTGTAFAEGKRFVGTTLVWMLKSAATRTDPDKISARDLDDGGNRPDNKPDN